MFSKIRMINIHVIQNKILVNDTMIVTSTIELNRVVSIWCSDIDLWEKPDWLAEIVRSADCVA
jgi:hypothetical protein